MQCMVASHLGPHVDAEPAQLARDRTPRSVRRERRRQTQRGVTRRHGRTAVLLLQVRRRRLAALAAFGSDGGGVCGMADIEGGACFVVLILVLLVRLVIVSDTGALTRRRHESVVADGPLETDGSEGDIELCHTNAE
jgi:hypothetical protein